MSLTISVAEIINKSTSDLLKKHQSWERVELSSIAKVLNGYAFNSEYFTRQKGVPLIRIRDISRNATETNYDGSYEEIYLVQPDDLLVGMDGDFNCALWNGPVGLLNQRVCKLEVYQEFFSKKFLSYVLPGYLKAINDVTSSITVKHLSSKSVEEILLPLPSLPEQSRIVAIIEQQFTHLDSAVASLQSAKARVKQYRASLLASAVEGELTKEWRVEHSVEETSEQLLRRILVERRARWEEAELAKMREKGIVPRDNRWKQRYKEPQGPDVEKLLKLPDGWCWATVEQLAATEENSITDGPFGSNLKTEHYKDSGPRIIRLQNIGDGLFKDEKAFISQDHFDKLHKHRIFAGDLVIAGLGEKPPRSCIIPDFVGPAIVKADCIRYKVSPHILNTYINIVLNAEPTRKRTSAMLHGIGRPRLNLSEIKSIIIALPPFAEQQYIMSEVEAKLSNIEQLEVTIEADLKRAEHERQSILQEAFAGRLVLQDMNDEPASVLLERIREERKKREEAEQTGKEGRKMAIAQQRKNRKNVAPLYDVLIDAGGELTPEELYKHSDNQRKNMPEEERDEGFYIELDAEVTASLIREDRPAPDKILLHALEQNNEDPEGGEEQQELEMRETLEEQEWSQLNLDKYPKDKERQTKEDVNKPSLWDE